MSVFFILIPTLPIYLIKSGSGEAEIGVLVGIFFVSALALRPFVGRALIRIPEKIFMVTGAVLFAVTSLAYLVAPPFWPLFMVRAFQGIGLALFHTASFTLVANISPKDHWTKSELLFSCPQYLLSPPSFLGDVPHQPLQFHLSLPDLLGFIVMRSRDYPPIQKEDLSLPRKTLRACFSVGRPFHPRS